MPEAKTPRQVLEAFYQAEKIYMQAKASGEEASFDDIAVTLDPAVVLHQSPDLPFGREYVGHDQYEQWANTMSSIFDRLEVAEQQWFEGSEVVVVVCRFKTHSRRNDSYQDLPMAQVVTVKGGKITDFGLSIGTCLPTSMLHGRSNAESVGVNRLHAAARHCGEDQLARIGFYNGQPSL